jgi:hypothetical protein
MNYTTENGNITSGLQRTNDENGAGYGAAVLFVLYEKMFSDSDSD